MGRKLLLQPHNGRTTVKAPMRKWAGTRAASRVKVEARLVRDSMRRDEYRGRR